MKRFLLDTSALLTLRDDEPGADEVAALLRQAQRGEVTCRGCFISLMEVFYRVWKDEGESAGRLTYRQCQSLPMTWIHETPALLEKAAELKARHPISLADAWIAAAAHSWSRRTWFTRTPASKSSLRRNSIESRLLVTRI